MPIQSTGSVRALALAGPTSSGKTSLMEALLQATGTTTAISWYILVATLVGAAATLCLRDRRGIPLGPDHETEQASGATMFAPNVAHREVVGIR